MENQPEKNNNLAIGLVVIGLVAALAIGGYVYSSNQNKTTDTAQVSTAPTATPQSNNMMMASDSAMMAEYKDGSYTADGSYTTPGGQEMIGVTLTLANGVVTEVEVEEKGIKPISKEKQADFAKNYKTQVVGKKIDEINLTKVSGSSLTPKGFNAALELIKAEAGA